MAVLKDRKKNVSHALFCDTVEHSLSSSIQQADGERSERGVVSLIFYIMSGDAFYIRKAVFIRNILTM